MTTLDPRWPNGKPGNHRSGATKGTKSGRRRGQIPATQDLYVIRRRQLVLEYVNKGYTTEQTLVEVNNWIESPNGTEGSSQQPVSLSTIKADRRALLKSMTAEFDADIEAFRNSHLMSLQYTMQQAWEAFDAAKDGHGNPAAFLNVVLRCIELMAKIDGSLKAAEVTALVVNQGMTFEEFDKMIERVNERAEAEGIARASSHPGPSPEGDAEKRLI